MMFRDKSASAIVAARDLARARQFYSGTLGLEAEEENDQLLAYRTGATRLIVYKSDKAGTNQANAVVWDAGEDFDAIADELRGKGVRFEEYPELGMEIADGVHRSGGFKAVWFKDPDGNILHFNTM